MKISVIGTGYVGLTTGACLANLGHDVVCCDIDSGKIEKLEKAEIPFYEPGLREIVQKNIDNGRLKFSTKPEETIEYGEVIFNCVGTPQDQEGKADLQYVYKVAEQVSKTTGDKILVNKSTVPPGTARKMQAIMPENVKVVSNPEFLKEGAAVQDFNHPDRIIIGGEQTETVKRVYSGLQRTYIPILETNWETAETIKYAANCFLATKISFINEIANISEKVGADIKIVAKGIGMDYRISPKFLNAGIGYGGSCFPKDVQALIHRAKEENYDAKILQEVHEFNERQKRIIADKAEKHLGELKDKTIAILGLSFKPKTSDTRSSPALTIIPELLRKGAKIKAYDPQAMEEMKKEHPDIEYCEDAYDTVKEADAMLLLTEWDDFRNLDFERVKELMNGNVVCDGRNIYDPQMLKEIGFSYEGVGR